MAVVVQVNRARLGGKSEVLLPEEVRQALGLTPGDDLAFVIDGTDVGVVRLLAEDDDTFSCFSEWGTEADREGYADL